jgi:hypothetical protein
MRNVETTHDPRVPEAATSVPDINLLKGRQPRSVAIRLTHVCNQEHRYRGSEMHAQLISVS